MQREIRHEQHNFKDKFSSRVREAPGWTVLVPDKKCTVPLDSDTSLPQQHLQVKHPFCPSSLPLSDIGTLSSQKNGCGFFLLRVRRSLLIAYSGAFLLFLLTQLELFLLAI